MRVRWEDIFRGERERQNLEKFEEKFGGKICGKYLEEQIGVKLDDDMRRIGCIMRASSCMGTPVRVRGDGERGFWRKI